MKTLNKVSLIGNLGKDPEIKHLQDNISVAKIALATTETFRDNAGKQHVHTDWHSVILWRGLAELADKYLRKGSFVYIEGKLKTRTYDSNDGTRKQVTEIIADKLIMLDKKTDASPINSASHDQQ
ncbi:single-stranded DNA-binding protein [Dyadobacter psychrotolerans]|uniref:Single-stranded DNA-binding protein n=1 Tax=Dyadobacter psychrotolerans TaxID=2541721 RepID=A0A4R5DRT2_9BACT|nr:single-stranded DNA-binding protein [Dyadobacter psychrotolerans]TDE17132.1 single-stranded DNA-binding protein [Dyadobacter psychrotolerans]